MRERILAIVGAIALVVVAVVVRGIFTDDGGSGSSARHQPVVACTLDLAPVCAALAADGKIAADPPTLDLPAAASPKVDGRQVDGWITWDPAPGIANLDADRAGNGQPWGSPVPLAGSPLGIASRTTSPAQLPAGCHFSPADWSCVAGAAIGQTPVGVGTGKSAESLARLYPLAATLVPKDGDFRDIDPGDLRSIVDSTNVAQAAFPSQAGTLVTQPGALNVLVGPLVGLRAIKGVQVSTPTTPILLTVVLVPRRGTSLGGLAAAATGGASAQALRDLGVVPGEGKLAPESRAGELYAVRDEVGS